MLRLLETGQPGVELFLAMSIFPIFMLPLVIQKLLSLDLNNMAVCRAVTKQATGSSVLC